MSDPERLLDGRDPLARALLASARSPGPTNAECDALWRSLAPRLPEAVLVGAAGAALSKAGGAKAVVSWALLLKTALAIGIATSAVAVVAVRAWPTDPAVVAPVSSAPVVPPPIVVSVAAPVVEAPPTVPVSSLPEAIVAPVSVRPRATAASPPPPPPPEPVVESSLGAESALLLHARKTLRSGNCAAAQRELDDARGRFVGGTLAQEREVLTIEALACSGQRVAASARAAAFRRDYPASPHADAVRKFEP